MTPAVSNRDLYWPRRAAVLLAEGSEAALGQHLLWGTLLLFLIVYGPGKFSLDYLLDRSRF
jgi:uncharacterized membrane protein YphA (DoxX/SURF4 family)